MTEQGTQDWHAWRNEGLGSSDAPIVMGLSPWTTRYQLWLQKTGIVPKIDEPSYIQERGHRIEPRARAAYEIEQGFIDMPPCICEHEDFPWLRASLDGRNEGLRRILEIKAPGEKDHALALSGMVPPKYYAQIQHQLLVTGDDECHYWSYMVKDEGKPTEKCEGALVIVKPDMPFIVEMFGALTAFWGLVECRIPPDLVHADYKGLNVAGLNGLCKDFAAVMDELKATQAKAKALREQILTYEQTKKAPLVRCKRVRIHWTDSMMVPRVNPLITVAEETNDEPG